MYRILKTKKSCFDSMYESDGSFGGSSWLKSRTLIIQVGAMNFRKHPNIQMFRTKLQSSTMISL